MGLRQVFGRTGPREPRGPCDACATTAPAPLKRTPLHALHVARGGKMVPFAGYEMPVQYRGRRPQGAPAYPRRRRPVRRLAYGPDCAAAESGRSTMPRWRSSAWCRRISSGLRRDGSATRSSPTMRGGILDDLMVANFGRPSVPGGQCRRKDDDEAHLRAHLSDACAIEPLADRALIALQGPSAESVLARSARTLPRCVHGCRSAPRSTASTASSRAPAIPARTASRFRCRPSRPRASRSAAGKQRRAADRARRARQPAARGRALPLRPRHRHHDHAGRGRAGMVDPEEPPRRRRARRRLSRRGQISRAARQRRAAPPRRPEARRPRPGARRRAAIRRRRVSEPSARSPRAASARASTRRSRWATCPLRCAPGTWCSPTCAASACRCRSCRCPSFPTPTSADER